MQVHVSGLTLMPGPSWCTAQQRSAAAHPGRTSPRPAVTNRLSSYATIPLYEQTLTDTRRVLGDDHPHTLVFANNLASAYRAMGDLGRAIPLFEQTLTDRRGVLGEDHLLTRTVLP
jgi:hypothetical protein